MYRGENRILYYRISSVSLLYAVARHLGTLQVISIHSIEINKLRMHPGKQGSQTLSIKCHQLAMGVLLLRLARRINMYELLYGNKSG